MIFSGNFERFQHCVKSVCIWSFGQIDLPQNKQLSKSPALLGLKQIEWWVQNGPNFANNYFIILKILFRFNSIYPNVHILTFYRHWSFIWRCLFLVSILNKLAHVLLHPYCACRLITTKLCISYNPKIEFHVLYYAILHKSIHIKYDPWCKIIPLSANPTKWSNTLKQFVSKLLTNCLCVFDHFVKLALKGLLSSFINNVWISTAPGNPDSCQALIHTFKIFEKQLTFKYSAFFVWLNYPTQSYLLFSVPTFQE